MCRANDSRQNYQLYGLCIFWFEIDKLKVGSKIKLYSPLCLCPFMCFRVVFVWVVVLVAFAHVFKLTGFEPVH